jgi:hypothetical protein
MDERAAEDAHRQAHEPDPHPRPRHASRSLEESLQLLEAPGFLELVLDVPAGTLRG